MKSYGNKHGALTVLGDSLMVVLAILVAYGLLQSNAEFSTYIICMLVSLYFQVHHVIQHLPQIT